MDGHLQRLKVRRRLKVASLAHAINRPTRFLAQTSISSLETRTQLTQDTSRRNIVGSEDAGQLVNPGAALLDLASTKIVEHLASLDSLLLKSELTHVSKSCLLKASTQSSSETLVKLRCILESDFWRLRVSCSRMQRCSIL